MEKLKKNFIKFILQIPLILLCFQKLLLLYMELWFLNKTTTENSLVSRMGSQRYNIMYKLQKLYICICIIYYSYSIFLLFWFLLKMKNDPFIIEKLESKTFILRK